MYIHTISMLSSLIKPFLSFSIPLIVALFNILPHSPAGIYPFFFSRIRIEKGVANGACGLCCGQAVEPSQ